MRNVIPECGLVIVLLAMLLNGCSKQPQEQGFRMPGEFEVHEAVWLGWEDNDTSYHRVSVAMIKALLSNVRVDLVVKSDSVTIVAKDVLTKHGIDTNQVTFHRMPGERYWIRDHGATFLTNEKGELQVVDFGWNLYGIEGWLLKKYNNSDSARKYYQGYLDPGTGKVDSLMAVATDASIIQTQMVVEGGAIEVNGKGTLILNEATMRQRNPSMTKETMEAEMKRVLHVTNIIWLKSGLAEDEHILQVQLGKYYTIGTGGHTDEFVRFADPSTILLAWVDENELGKHPFNRINYERMNENLRILEASRDQDGNPFTIIKVPLPDPIEKHILVKNTIDSTDNESVKPGFFLPDQAPQVGDTLIQVAASSYLNYLVTNGMVLLPTYGDSSEKEERVAAIFHRLWPDRKQVWIGCMTLNWSGGGLHCSTQQQPARSTR